MRADGRHPRRRAPASRARPRSVRIDEDALEPYARTLPAESPPAPDLDGADDETRAAFSLQLNAINFGSGWFPTLRKPHGLSGFRTVEAAPARAAARGRRASSQASRATEIAADVRAGPRAPADGPLRGPPRELGERVDGASWVRARPRHASRRSPTELAAGRPGTTSRRTASGDVPFFKRAQIAAADLALSRARPTPRPGSPDAVRRQPRPARAAHRRRARFDADLVPASTPRSCSSTTRPRRSRSAPARCTRSSCSSGRPWRHDRHRRRQRARHRGAAARYKARPRHRARTTAY